MTLTEFGYVDTTVMNAVTIGIVMLWIVLLVLSFELYNRNRYTAAAISAVITGIYFGTIFGMFFYALLVRL